VTAEEARRLLDQLRSACNRLEDTIIKGDPSPEDLSEAAAALRAAVLSTAACELAKKRHPNAKCPPYPKEYKGPKGPELLGTYSTKTGFTKTPSLSNKAFWGE